jgi:phosphate transport system permease protein
MAFGRRAKDESPPQGETLLHSAALATREGEVRAPRAKQLAFKGFLLFSVLIGIATLITLIVIAFIDGLPRLNLDLFTEFPSSIPSNAGLQSAIVGSIYLMVGVAAVTLPRAVATTGSP